MRPAEDFVLWWLRERKERIKIFAEKRRDELVDVVDVVELVEDEVEAETKRNQRKSISLLPT